MKEGRYRSKEVRGRASGYCNACKRRGPTEVAS